MSAVVRSLIMLAWFCSWRAAASAAGVSPELALVIPAAALLSSALVPLLTVGARLLPVALAVTSSWLLAALTWGEVWASALVGSALVLVVWLTWQH
ncbi:hypothetical protein [Nonomuraea diastatica]|uniref:Branched-chain amino acid ABC transporter n=1 Tax=Nonomuraea diastatica TaxID=1848329 RepID=A0A4R4WMM7_9ACTN|nr:hypothetical protein [Nonomuraea diastatica]TDD15050.1 hypothetical protein E1294_35655 [Nonomuraea diastatica]